MRHTRIEMEKIEKKADEDEKSNIEIAILPEPNGAALVGKNGLCIAPHTHISLWHKIMYAIWPIAILAVSSMSC